MGLRVIILGCGSSGGVPRIGGDWGVCDPSNPKNARTRSSILVQKWDGDGPSDQGNCTTILVDTSPDLRMQLIRENIARIDAVLYTHDHADQAHGIDDLRPIAYRMRQRIPTYMCAHSKTHIYDRFQYCFEVPEGRVHPAILELQPLLNHGNDIIISGPGGDIEINPIGVSHGPTPALGFIFDKTLAYIPDVWDIEDQTLTTLDGLECFIVDSLRYSPHPTHAHADKTLSWLARTQVKSAVLTNLHIDMDYENLSAELPPIATPAYDGMVVEF